jgi:hypothetical protein
MDGFWHQIVLGTGTPSASGPVLAKEMVCTPERRCEGGGQRPPRARAVARPGQAPAQAMVNGEADNSNQRAAGFPCAPAPDEPDCITENHMELLRSLEGEERHEALRRIQRSRQAASRALQVGMGADFTPGAISEAQKELKELAESMDPQSPGSPFSSRHSATFAGKVTSAKSVRMLRRSTWDGTMEKPLAHTERSLTSATSSTVPRESSQGSENPEPMEVRESENEGKIADQPSPTEPKGDAVLTPLLRLVGVAPRLSVALAEQIQLDARLLLPELKRTEPGPSPNTVGYKPGSRRSLGKAAGASVRTGFTRT